MADVGRRRGGGIMGESEGVGPKLFSKSRSRGRLRPVVAVATAEGPEGGERGGENVDDEEDNGRLLPTPLPDVTEMDIAAAIEALSYGCGRALKFVIVGEAVMDEEAERDVA